MKAPKALKMKKTWIAAFVLGVLGGIFGYKFGVHLADVEGSTPLRTYFGISETAEISLPTLGAAAFFVFLSFLQAIVLLVSHFNSKVRRSAGVEAQFGDGKKGRASLPPLALSSAANGVFISLLTYLSLVEVSKDSAFAMIGIGLVCAIILVVTSIQLAGLLDELVRGIWVDALAISSGVVLLIVMLVSLFASLGIIANMSALQGVLAFNYVYFFAYMALTAKRTPEAFTNPTLDGEAQ